MKEVVIVRVLGLLSTGLKGARKEVGFARLLMGSGVGLLQVVQQWMVLVMARSRMRLK